MNTAREAAKAIVKGRLLGPFKRLVESLVLHPEDMTFELLEGRFSEGMVGIPVYVVSLRPHRADFPRLFGKHRKMFQAIEEIARSIGECSGYGVKMGRLLEDGPGVHDYYSGRRDWRDGRKKLVEMLGEICPIMFRGEAPVVELIENDPVFDTLIRIKVSPDDPLRLTDKRDALQVVAKTFCAGYGKLPQVEIEQG